MLHKASMMAALGPKEPAPAEEGDLTTVAADLIQAVKAGDVEGVAAALQEAHGICAAGYTEDAEV